MIWLALLPLVALTLLPFALSLRPGATLRDYRPVALALHRAQLGELARERDAGRLNPTEYDAALLEIQRRLLAADQTPTPRAKPPLSFPLTTLVPLLPLLALLLYLPSGEPNMPEMLTQLAERRKVVVRQLAEENGLITELRRQLTEIDVGSEQGRQGHVLLGNAEMRRGNMKEAADAWRAALDAGFDPAVAVLAGAAIIQAEGKLTVEAAVLFRRALAEGSPDAPWRPMVERRLRETSP